MIYHSGIFYPDTKEELIKLVTPIEEKETHKAFILPHMELKSIAHLYREVFGSIRNGMRIIALIPIHREVLIKDNGKKLFSPLSRIEETTLGNVKIESLGYDDSAPYEEEEYSLELLYPFIAYHNPDSVLYPVFAHLESGEDTKKLANDLKKLDDGNTVFIASSNMTAKMETSDVECERDKMVSLLENGEKLMERWKKGRISACGTPLIESISRIGSGRWHLLGISEKETKAGHAALYMD